ncbi:MAG: gliding motility-associated C-terminal domain-containing protein, partial [Bacteroidia bacterium]
MKKLKQHIFICIIFLCSISVNAQTDCFNGNVELGNFSNWSAATNNVSASGNVNFSSNVYGLSPGRHTIMTAGFDPILGGTTLPVVNQGAYSIRLGNSSTNAEADLLKYTFVVTNANKNFGFRYALVLQEPGHAAAQQPSFSYMIYKTSSWTGWATLGNMINSGSFAASPSSPYFASGPAGVLWRNWTTQCIDLSNYVGQTVSILFQARDCAQGGHYGYAYIDALCENNDAIPSFTIDNDVCLGSPLIADGSASTLETGYFWSIQESNTSWTPIGTEYYQSFLGAAGTMDIGAFIQAHGGTLKCNTYYRVKLAVSSSCTGWNETTQLIFVRCPNVPEIPDVVMCCGNSQIQYVGPKDNPLYTYNWAVNPITFPYSITPHGNSISFVNPPGNATFTLNVTDEFGCTSSQEIKVLLFSNFSLKIKTEKEGCCRTKITADIGLTDCNGDALSQADYNAMLSYFSFNWSNGQNGQSIYASDADSTLYTVYVSSPCISKTASAWHTGGAFGPFTPLITSNAFTPNGDNVNDVFRILEFGPTAPSLGQCPAYNATGYDLYVWNRWGGLIYHKTV